MPSSAPTPPPSGHVRTTTALALALGALVLGMGIGGVGLSRGARSPEPAPAGTMPQLPPGAALADADAPRVAAPRALREEDRPAPRRARELATDVPRGAGDAGESAPAAAPRAEDLPAGSARRRAAELGAEADDALRRGDGKRAFALLRDVIALGEEADLPAIELTRKIADQLNQGKKIGVTSYELNGLLRTAEAAPLLKRALLDPTADAAFRSRAVDHLAYSPNGDTLPFVLSLVEQEPNGRVRRAMLGYLEEQSDPAVGGAIARTFERMDVKDASERARMLEMLGQAAGDEARATLERTAAADPDPDVRRLAQVELIARNPPATGYLISTVGERSQALAAGLQPGDLILSYNGVPLGPEVSIRAERERVPQGASVPVTIWRNGQAITVTMKAGALGIDGRSVVRQ